MAASSPRIDADILFEHGPELLALLSEDGVVRRLSLAWDAPLARSREALVGTPLLASVHPEDRERTAASLRDVVAAGGTSGFDSRVAARDGTWRTLRWRVAFEPRSRLLVCGARDVSAERHAEERLRVAERLVAVGRLAAGVAHEINNPLAVITANVDYVQSTLPPSGEEDAALVEDTLAALRETAIAAERMRRIVHDLRQFAGVDVTLGPLALRGIVESAIRDLPAPLRQRAELHVVDGEMPAVLGDERRLTRVLAAILQNAFLAIPDGRAASHAVVLRASRLEPDRRVALDVSDSGAGMTEEVRRQIFDPFFSTRPTGEGVGLGLSVCLGLMRAMGGDIEVVSEPAAGSRFRLVLPGAA
ncbi:MAG: sensor histidine kinase [Myxococcales bacterium]